MDGATTTDAAAGAAAFVEGPPAAGPCVGAGAAGVERRVVVDGAGRSALLDVATSANAAAGAAACVGGALRMIVGSLRRDAPPALMFIISAWEAGTAAH